jgi:hypothetical protein
MAKHPHGFNPQQYVNTLQAHRASLAFRDEQYDRAHAAAARSPAVREFYANEAEVDHRFGERRLVAAKNGKPLKAP